MRECSLRHKSSRPVGGSPPDISSLAIWRSEHDRLAISNVFVIGDASCAGDVTNQRGDDMHAPKCKFHIFFTIRLLEFL